MTLLWSIHLYPPKHNCGAEYMAHHLNKLFISQGHHARVLLHQANQYRIKNPYELDRVQVYPPIQNFLELFRTANIICTHLDYTWQSIQWARQMKRPLVHFVHNDIPYQSIQNAPEAFVVYNSEWIAKKLNYPNRSMVLPPPCDYRYYDVCERPEENEYITLINLNENKGGRIFYEIARAMPDRKFLAVEGSYDPQILKDLPNVTRIANTPDILPVYRQTRILLMPSLYESWGRTATEAMASGIPVICTPTEGLKENCGEAGIYIEDREDVEAWVKAIKKLDKVTEYKKQSTKCRMRSRQLDPVEGLKKLEAFFRQIVS